MGDAARLVEHLAKRAVNGCKYTRRMTSDLLRPFLAVVVAGFALGANAESTDCAMSGSALARCAASWEAVFAAGNQLRDPGQSYEAGYFDGMVVAVGYAYLQRGWCPAAPFNVNQISAVTAKYIRANPERWGERSTTIVLEALAKFAPCKK